MSTVAKLLVFGVMIALVIAPALDSGITGWHDDLRRRCVAQGGQVIEQVSRIHVGCLLPVGMERLAESP